jgi:hypothetical protein
MNYPSFGGAQAQNIHAVEGTAITQRAPWGHVQHDTERFDQQQMRQHIQRDGLQQHGFQQRPLHNQYAHQRQNHHPYHQYMQQRQDGNPYNLYMEQLHVTGQYLQQNLQQLQYIQKLLQYIQDLERRIQKLRRQQVRDHHNLTSGRAMVDDSAEDHWQQYNVPQNSYPQGTSILCASVYFAQI